MNAAQLTLQRCGFRSAEEVRKLLGTPAAKREDVIASMHAETLARLVAVLKQLIDSFNRGDKIGAASLDAACRKLGCSYQAHKSRIERIFGTLSPNPIDVAKFIRDGERRLRG